MDSCNSVGHLIERHGCGRHNDVTARELASAHGGVTWSNFTCLPKDYDNLPAFLIALSATEVLETPASGIAKQAITRGFESLTDKQKYALGAAIAEHMEACIRCGERLTFEELADHDRGLCYYCRHMQ